MNLSTNDYLKKTLLDTQERVRDFMYYTEIMKDPELKEFFHQYAEDEGYRASAIRDYIESSRK